MRRRSRMVAVSLRAGLIAALVLGSLIAWSAPGARWRMQFLALKLAGQLPELSWREMAALTAPGSGVWPEAIWETWNPYVAVRAPWTAPADLIAGRDAFASHCAECHGSDAQGASARGLLYGPYRNGVSDLALFQTTLRKSTLAPGIAWRVVAFLKQAMQDAGAQPPAATQPVRGGAPFLMAPTRSIDESFSARWTSHRSAPDGRNHSRLARINRENVGGLRSVWTFELPAWGETVQSTPLVCDETLFVNLPDGGVYALDLRTGRLRWRRDGRSLPADLTPTVEGLVNRGLAMSDGVLFAASIDGRLSALDAGTGALRWEVNVADYRDGYRLVGAPLAVDGAVVIGVGGGDRAVRGFLDAYAVATGQRLWRFETVPGPGEPGHDTWGDSPSWRTGGGVTPATGTYDRQLGLVYWGVGAPAPAFRGDVRPGDNLYTSGVIALEAATGRLRWFFQISPHDERDWGAAHTPVLMDAAHDGQPRNLLGVASRNGFLYVLDRTDGTFLAASAFVHQTWAEGFAADGRPMEVPYTRPMRQGALVYPGHAGATGWASPSHDPERNLFFVLAREGYGNVYFANPRLHWPDGAYWGGQAAHLENAAAANEVRALDPWTGELRWRYRFPPPLRYRAGGLLSTGGGLVFASEKGRFVALDADSGRELWRFEMADEIESTPITYLSGDRQQVSIVAGRVLHTFAVVAHE